MHCHQSIWKGKTPIFAGDEYAGVSKQCLYVKLFEEPASGRLWLRYDRLEGLPVERRLSILCFWVQRLSRENRPFALALPGAELPPGQGEEQRLRALNLLARHGDTEAH